MSYVLALDELEHAAAEWRRDGAVVVLACGTFDPLHVGHNQHLKAARKLGNVLVVAVTADAHVDKGPGRPRFPQSERAEAVADLSFVDAVVVNDGPDAVGLIALLRPHIYVKGSEYSTRKTPNLLAEEAAVAAVQGVTRFLSGPSVYSSTTLLAGAAHAH